eukprot:483056_1
MASDEKTTPSALTQPNLNLHDSLRENLSSIVEKDEFGDVIFIIGDQHFTGIRALFAAQSEVFRNMLFGNYSESVSKDKAVILQDITPEAFTFIRSMFYFQNPKLTCDIIVDVLYASQIYFIKTLITKCHQYLLNIEKTKNWYKILKSYAKYPESTFYPFFKIFIQNCKALNIANCIEHQHNNDNKIKEINMNNENDNNNISNSNDDNTNHNNDNYYFDKYLLLNDNLFEKYLLYWQIEEMLKCGINDERMFKACIRWSKNMLNRNSKNNCMCLCDDKIEIETETETETNIIINNKNDIIITDWNYYMKKLINYFDFNKFNIDYLCDEINKMKFISKDKIISILRFKLSNSSSKMNIMTGIDEKTNQHILDEIKDGFHMNEMLLTDSDLSSLRVGDKIDHRDYKGRWCKASITQKQFMFIKLHYVGWNSQYDCWIHISEDYEKLAKYGRITRRQVQRKLLQNLKINDKVLIRLPSCHRFHYMSWIKAKVSYIEEDTGQIKFTYGITQNSDAKYSWWTHPDNVDECKPYHNTNTSINQQQDHNHDHDDDDDDDGNGDDDD